jgi:hypothetical protein
VDLLEVAAQRLERGGRAAEPDAEREPPAGEHVERRDLAAEHDGVMVR